MEEIMDNVNDEVVDTAIEVATKSSGKNILKYGVGAAVVLGVGYAATKYVFMPIWKKHKNKKTKDVVDGEVVDNVKIAENDFVDYDESAED